MKQRAVVQTGLNYAMGDAVARPCADAAPETKQGPVRDVVVRITDDSQKGERETTRIGVLVRFSATRPAAADARKSARLHSLTLLAALR